MYCHEESALKLAAFALQAEKGDQPHPPNNQSYFRLEDFVPEKVRHSVSYCCRIAYSKFFYSHVAK